MGWMSGLADPTRLRLVHLLERHELGVAELCEVLQLPQSTVSRHLKVLADLGWIRQRRKGTARLYHAAAEELDPAARNLWNLAHQQVGQWATLNQDRLRLVRCLQKREQGPKAFFADAASKWDQMRAELYGPTGPTCTTAAMLALLPSQWTVADLGCGTGPLLADLSPCVKRVIGVDQSPEMLDAARQRTQTLPNVELRRGELEALPIEDDSCDAALLVLVLSYLEEPGLAIAQAARIVKPGGKVVALDLLRHDHNDFRRKLGQRWMGFDDKELGRWFSDARLKQTIIRPLENEPVANAPALLLAVGEKSTQK